MPLVIQQWIVLVVMFVLVIAVVSWSATHLGKRTRKAESIDPGSENLLPSENTTSLERELRDFDSFDLFTTSEKSTTAQTSGTAVTLEILKDSSTLGTLEKFSKSEETGTSEVTDASSTKKNTKVSERSESFTFSSTTECLDTKDYQRDKETSSSLITPQDIQEFASGNFSI